MDFHENTSPDIKLFLHRIVIAYEAEAATYFNQCKTTKKFGKFNFKNFARKVFDPCPTEILGNLYVQLFETSSEYMHMHRKSQAGIRNVPQSILFIPELLMNIILAYQLPYQQKEAVPQSVEKSEDGSSTAEEKTSRKKKKSGSKNVI
ncbi:unnamed protein product [Caenorhabditis bovis]|uniref:Uncharacterized protein n=1 Tax=Caenorhabditis bovis TaxID=2654633 RepID=A0A8S1EXT6_9PELO|nr:unnamed protein product [Caenorhabditis bovis]